MKKQQSIEKGSEERATEWIISLLPQIFTKAVERSTASMGPKADKSFCPEQDIFLMQNKGKGPPGRRVSLRGGRSLEPDCKQQLRIKIDTNKQQRIQINKQSNFQINFTIQN